MSVVHGGVGTVGCRLLDVRCDANSRSSTALASGVVTMDLSTFSSIIQDIRYGPLNGIIVRVVCYLLLHLFIMQELGIL